MNDYPTRIGYTQALQIVATVAHARRLSTEHRPIQRAEGHVLACDLLAPIDLPAFDNSRMDGFALRHADLAAAAETRLRIIGEQAAQAWRHRFARTAGPGLEVAGRLQHVAVVVADILVNSGCIHFFS